MHKILLFTSALFLYTTTFGQQKKQAIQPDDIYRIPALNGPQISPDGLWVVYSLSVPDTAKDNRISRLWMQSYDGKESIQLTYGDESVSSPKWSPDNKFISFKSSRDSKNGAQIWLLDRRGGEGSKLTNLKGSINDYSWSPDDQQLLLTIADPENGGKADTKTPLPIKIDRYHFKQDVAGYLQHLHEHLYLFNINTKKIDTLTKGDYDENSAEFSPDGSKIVFVSNHTADPDKNENTDIFIIDSKANSIPKQITLWKGREQSPHWSPYGKFIVYIRSTSDADYLMYDQGIMCLMDSDGKNNLLLTQALDRPVTSATWSKDGKEIYFLTIDDRERYLSRYELADKKIKSLLRGKFSINEFITGEHMVIQLSNPYVPAELYAYESGNLRRLTFHQNELLNSVNLAHVEGFTSKSSDGTLVSGLVYTPDSINRKKLPLILFIHGGPVG